MDRTIRLLTMAVIGMCLATQSAVAAPVTLGAEDYDAFASAGGPTDYSGPVAEEEPAEAAPPLLFQQGMVPAGSMSGNPSSTVTSGMGAATALSDDAPAYEPALLRLYLLGEDSVFIPPRFLDGIFRPPRSLVSL